MEFDCRVVPLVLPRKMPKPEINLGISLSSVLEVDTIPRQRPA
jgi:hypothetical protein